MRPRPLFLVLFCSALVTITGVAGAQTGSAKEREFFEVKEADGSSVIFKDDPLTAPGMDAVGATIKLRGRPARTLLIRPRLQFLAELMKSAETL